MATPAPFIQSGQFSLISDMAGRAQWANESPNVCPEAVMLEDGTWRNAPWMSWDADSYFWRCWMCSTSGVRVTNDHLATPRHTNRVSPDSIGNYLGWYSADVGRQQMLRVQVHANYLNRRQQQLALPAPPGEPPAQPPPEAPPQQQQQQAPPVPAPAPSPPHPPPISAFSLPPLLLLLLLLPKCAHVARLSIERCP